MSIKHSQTRRGDTIIEVMFAIAVFGLVSILTVNLMNNGLASAENNLESTMARNEMDAQAAALNFIHSSYVYSGGTAYKSLWQNIVNQAEENNSGFSPTPGGSECSAFVSNEGSAHPFVLDTTSIQDEGNSSLITTFDNEDYAYPIVNHGNASGIWINAVPGKVANLSGVAYYDFYISTCWYGVGSNSPTTLDTVVRLFNPDRT